MSERRGVSGRGAVSVILIVLATVVAVAGGVTLYVRDEIVDSGAFADRAVDALQQPAVRRVVAREIVVQLVERSSQDLVAARPVLQSVVDSIVASEPFAGVIRLAAEHGHRLLFERAATNAAFDVADAGTVVTSALRKLAPNLVKYIPPQTQTVLVTLRRRSFASATLRFADRIRVLGIVLPLLAVLLVATAILVAPRRRTAVTRLGIAFGTAAVITAIVLELLRLYVGTHVYGTQELTNADVRGAVGGLWSAYLGDLMTWILAAGALAWTVAAASASLLAPYSGTAGLARLRGLARAPSTPAQRAVRGGAGIVAGLVLILEPMWVLRVIVVACGVLLLYVAIGELLTGIEPATPRVAGLRAGRRRLVAAVVTVAALTIGLGLVFALGGRAPSVRASAIQTCNGYAQLCSRRLDQVVFAGTHNAMSASDSPGWYIANQDRAIGQQLEDGIRAFKISTHYGIQDAAGHVRTDIKAEGARVNRVAEKLTPQAREALQRLGQAVGLGSLSGTHDIWLCHTLCELGGTKMVDFLGVIRTFTELNPGQVVILFDEDYVGERDLQNVFKRAGLLSHLETLQPGRPLPTLGELIRSGRNVLVFAQNPVSGGYAWDMPGFTWIQDTPLGAVKPAQFTCKLNRGAKTNPLLMMNNWADIFPPRPKPNKPLVQRDFILARARQCLAQRGKVPNIILTDYYNRGDVVGAVQELNGLAGVPPAPVTPLNPVP
ncbi:MAG TPA: hypothetical protein VNR66_15425 [Solirubrobacteraceae bacterium]|nr:hypothetical protein [Solirubrobacteraceae bacterium]